MTGKPERSFDSEIATIRRRLRLLALLTCMLPVLLALLLALSGLRERLRTNVLNHQATLDAYGTLYLQKKFGLLERQLETLSARLNRHALASGQPLNTTHWPLPRDISPLLNDAFFFNLAHDRIDLGSAPHHDRNFAALAAERPWYGALHSSDTQPVWSEPYTDSDTGRELISVCSRTFGDDGKTTLGALCLEARLEDTLDTLTRISEDVRGELRLERADGSPVISLTRPNLPRSALADAALPQDSVFRWLSAGMRLEVALVKPEWTLKLLIPASRLRGETARELWQSLLPIALMFLLLGTALVLLWRRYQREQRHLSQCIEALRQGHSAPEAPTALFLHGNLRQLDRLADQLHAERRESLTDAVTGAFNRRAFDADLPALIQPGSGRALLVFDIDFFKQINDQFGHPMGDAVLRRLGTGFEEARLRGALYRIGGDEFALILEDAAELAAAAEALQQIARDTVWREREIRVSLSLGGARADEGNEPAQVFTLADERLYAAKRAGRARAVLP